MIKYLTFLPALFLSQTLWAGGYISGGNTGGMDGGGGGTLPAHPTAPYEVTQIAQEAKPQLLYLLNGYEWRESRRPRSPLGKKLFDGPRKVQEVLKGLRLETREDKPCFTSDGKEVDASIHAAKPNTICLSSFRISQKVDRAAAEREILALLMHEVSHFMGATEAEAVALQEDIAWTILNAKGAFALDGLSLRYGLEAFDLGLRSAIEALEKSDLPLASSELDNALTQLNTWESITTIFPSNFFGLREEQYQAILGLKLSWAAKYATTLLPNAESWEIDRYNESFKGHEYFVAGEESYVDAKSPYKNEKIMRLHSLAELKDTLHFLQQEYSLRIKYAYQAAFGMHWMNLQGDLTVPKSNPWEKVVGQYVVQSVQCNSTKPQDHEIEFVIDQTPSGLTIRKIFSSSSFTDRIEFAAYNLNSYLNSYGENPDGSVFMIHEMGGSWSRQDYADSLVSEFSLKKTSAKEFEITHKSSLLPKDVTKAETFKSCVYKGFIR